MRQEITLAHDCELGRTGDRVTLTLTPADVHDPTELSTYLAGFKPYGYRADEASPVILVDYDEDSFRQFSSDDAFRRITTKGSRTGAVPEVDPKSSLTPYKVTDRYVGSFIDAVTEGQVTNPGYRPRMAAARRCQNALMLEREFDVWNLLSTTTNWDPSVRTAVAGGSEWDTASGDPVKNIQDACNQSGQIVTEIWMNPVCAAAMIRNANFRLHTRQFLGDGPMPDLSGQIFHAGQQAFSNLDIMIPGIPPIRIVAAKYRNESTGSLDFVLSSDVAILIHRPSGGVPTDGEEISSTYTFRRRGPSGNGMNVREYQVPGRGAYGGTMIVVAVADVPLVTANIAGGIITNTLSTV